MSRRRIAEIIEDRDPQIFAGNVRRGREGLGWTRQRLCAEAKISPQTLARVEGGQGCTPGVERKISDALGTVLGRLWEPRELTRRSVNVPATDRWYFTSHADGERFWRVQSFAAEDEAIRYDPDAIQDEAERRRMGDGGLAKGFVRITTAHLSVGTIISSVIELYGRIDSDLPEGRLAYFHALGGRIRIHFEDGLVELCPGDVLQAEMGPGVWLEPAKPVAAGTVPPTLIYVDVAARPNGPRTG